MPKLPDATSLGARPGISDGRSLVQIRPSGMGEAIAGIGQQVESVGRTFASQAKEDYERKEAARRRVEMARANSAFLQQNSLLLDTFNGDKDFTTYEQRYQEQVPDMVSTAGEFITEPDQRALFEAQAGDDIVRSRIALREKSRGMQGQFDLANLQETAARNKEAYARSTDPVMQTRLLDEVRAQTDALSVLHPELMTPAKAAEFKRKYAEEVALPAFNSRPPREKLRILNTKLGRGATPSGYRDAITSAAMENGLAPDMLAKMLQIENPKLDPNAVSPTGVTGFVQMTSDTAARYGLEDPTDFAQSINAAAKKMAYDRQYLTTQLGRSVSDGEVYLAYQQGEGGAKALLANREGNVVDVLAPLYDKREDAVRAVVANGGNTQMSAGEFADKWINKYDLVAPVVLAGEKTRTEMDAVPFEKAQAMYSATAESAFYELAERNPVEAISALESPEFSGLKPEEKKVLEDKAYTIFDNARNRAALERVAVESQQQAEVYSQFMSGQLTEFQVDQLEADGKISREFGAYMRADLKKAVDQKSPTEQTERWAQLQDRLMAFQITAKKKAGSGSAEDYLRFQRDVYTSLGEGYLDKRAAASMLKQINYGLQKRIEDPDTTGWFSSPENAEGYRVIDEWLRAQGKADDMTVKGELLRRMTFNLDDQEEAGQDLNAGAAAKKALESYAKDTTPVLRMLPEVPNSVLTTAGSKQAITPGPRETKPDAKATVPRSGILRRDASGQYAIVFPDGTFQEVAASQVDMLKAQGY